MDNLQTEINGLISTINRIVEGLLAGKEVEPVKLFPVMMEQIGASFPMIVQDHPNSDYWMQLLNRISVAIESDDRFLILDILYHETRGSLLEYLQWRAANE